MGNQINMLLEAKGYTQGYLSKETGISQSYISKLCNGKSVPTLDKAYLIAKALNVPLEALLDNDIDLFTETVNYQSDLTRTEKALIQKLRTLSPDHQQAVYAIVDTYSDIAKELKKSSNSQEETSDSIAAY